jgi:antitoxin (DNA-binding transcriptional repressor) of toxin-antitoxin stability system
MTRIDLDDLPPKVAALLTGLADGDEVLLVRNGAVVGRLTGAADPGEAAEPEPAPEAQAKEIFELFRASIEDEF